MRLRGPCRQGAHSTAWQGRQTSDSASATQRAQCQDGANKGDPRSTKEGRPTDGVGIRGASRRRASEDAEELAQAGKSQPGRSSHLGCRGEAQGAARDR